MCFKLSTKRILQLKVVIAATQGSTAGMLPNQRSCLTNSCYMTRCLHESEPLHCLQLCSTKETTCNNLSHSMKTA